MSNEKQIENLNITSIKEIADICELNINLSKFQVVNDFIKQGLMFIVLKKGKKEIVSEKDIGLFKSKLLEMEQVIENIIS